MRKALTSPGMIVAVLITQFIPLILFPADSFAPTSQVWWLPALLAVMVLIADFQLIVRRSTSLDPWYLIAFVQGFNIISRLMMLWPHATQDVGGQTTLDGTLRRTDAHLAGMERLSPLVLRVARGADGASPPSVAACWCAGLNGCACRRGC